MSPVDELRQAATTLRDTRNCSNYDVDCDSLELLQLIGRLLRAREPLAALLAEAEDRWAVEVRRQAVDAPPGGQEYFHTDGCELVVLDATDENREADWRCSCFDNALAAARAVNARREASRGQPKPEPSPDEPHIVDLRANGWTIQHPLSCRPSLFDCPVNEAAEHELVDCPAELGRFACGLDDNGRFEIGDRVTDDAATNGSQP